MSSKTLKNITNSKPNKKKLQFRKTFDALIIKYSVCNTVISAIFPSMTKKKKVEKARHNNTKNQVIALSVL